MKLPISSGKQRKPKLFVRRVVGDSMRPTLVPGQIVVAISWLKPRPSKLVVVEANGRQIVKRLSAVEGSKVYILGDNEPFSTDSRKFGWINKKDLLATVIWPIK